MADEDGVEAAFEVVADIPESVRTGEWIGDCFIYTNNTNRLNYLVGDQTYTISHFDQPQYLLGYLPRDGRLYLADKDVNVISYSLSLTVVEYQTLVLRGDIDSAQQLLSEIPSDSMNKIARFLEGQGYKELALEVATDPEHKFELALSLNDLQTALTIAREADVEHKWKVVGDTALAAWDISLALECFTQARDLGSLLLVYSSSGDKNGLQKLAQKAEEMGSNNIAFSALWLSGDIDAAIELLVRTGRTSEAVLFSQTYKPSRTTNLVKDWKASLEKQGKGKVSRLIGVPSEDDELFPEWDEYIKLENEGGTADVKENLLDLANDDEPETEANGVEASGEEEEEEAESEVTAEV